jgi:hypothetical protein
MKSISSLYDQLCKISTQVNQIKNSYLQFLSGVQNIDAEGRYFGKNLEMHREDDDSLEVKFYSRTFIIKHFFDLSPEGRPIGTIKLFERVFNQRQLIEKSSFTFAQDGKSELTDDYDDYLYINGETAACQIFLDMLINALKG